MAWAVGDTAVCVWKTPAPDALEVGAYYTVTSVRPNDCAYDASPYLLTFAELKSQFPADGWFSSRFRKVVRDWGADKTECGQLIDFFKRIKEPV